MKPCEICNSRSRHKHHIQSKSKGGSNKSFNIAHLCPTCHDSVHRGDIIIEGKFQTTKGLLLLFHHKNEEVITENKPNCYIYGE